MATFHMTFPGACKDSKFSWRMDGYAVFSKDEEKAVVGAKFSRESFEEGRRDLFKFVTSLCNIDVLASSLNILRNEIKVFKVKATGARPTNPGKWWGVTHFASKMKSEYECLSMVLTEEVPVDFVPNLGVDNTGRGNQGDENVGWGNIGNWNTGCGNNGKNNTGNYNEGASNSGSFNKGRENSGAGNCGDSNSGNMNHGSFNAGSCNIGDFNVGCGNVGSGLVDFFCVESKPTVKCFDVETGLTYEEFVEKYTPKIIALSWAIHSGEPFTYKRFADLPGITRKKVEKLRKLFDKKNKEAGVKC